MKYIILEDMQRSSSLEYTSTSTTTLDICTVPYVRLKQLTIIELHARRLHPCPEGSKREAKMLDFPLGLRHALEAGECVLFLGAGIGGHLRDRSGNPTPDAATLASEIAQYFSID